jgi:hypothetical protein
MNKHPFSGQLLMAALISLLPIEAAMADPVPPPKPPRCIATDGMASTS